MQYSMGSNVMVISTVKNLGPGVSANHGAAQPPPVSVTATSTCDFKEEGKSRAEIIFNP